MFKIYDGRNEFYQWDLNCKLIVEDKSMSQVHFCNRTGECSLIRDVYEVNGMRLVDVPNILLQDNWDIKVYGWDASHTKRSTTYNVVARTRPENYVYTETEQLKWEMLEERIDEIESQGVSDEKLNSAINAYLDEHPVDVPVKSVNGKTGDVEITAADIGAMSADVQIPSTVGLATEAYVDEKVANVTVDTTGLATETFVEEYVDEQNFANKTYVKNYVSQEIEDALADFEPSGGTTEVDLSNYYNKKEVDTLIEEIELTPGPQGEQGPAGKDGNDGAAGLDGEDGYTPVKGVDYWTAEDQAAIVADVLAALPAAEEVSV